MKLGVLFSGGKDSTFATFLAKEYGHDVSCLISIISQNKESFMFHTPNIEKTKVQAESMNIPLIVKKTEGKKEIELKDLKSAILEAKKKYKIEGIVTGAVESVYQSSRVQKICNELNLECFNPLWQKPQFELLEDLIKKKFEVIVAGVFAYPLDGKWLGRKIDKNFINEMRILNEKYKISPAGEGGEFETFVLNAPGLFKKKLRIKDKEILGEKNSWRMELSIE
ncbi:MAG TPA: diphthine--ammonia ligase [Candidatus Nanoarchaeia archaeon]|nr:diphthine--ammonia ligase [Candidatus Nanoarchaeia archaeon]